MKDVVLKRKADGVRIDFTRVYRPLWGKSVMRIQEKSSRGASDTPAWVQVCAILNTGASVIGSDTFKGIEHTYFPAYSERENVSEIHPYVYTLLAVDLDGAVTIQGDLIALQGSYINDEVLEGFKKLGYEPV